MAATIVQPLADRLEINKGHRLVTCWRITRIDSIIIRVTDSEIPITLFQDTATPETFAAASGFTASAKQRESNLKPQNLSAIGVLDADAITNDDLRAGFYNGATVDELIVDSKYPWAGVFITNGYRIEKVAYTGLNWQVELVGIAGLLRREVGELYVRPCRYDLADARCGADISAMTQDAQTVDVVLTQRKSFESSVVGEPDGFFTFGRLIWTLGANVGVISEVASFVATDGVIEFRIPTPFDFAVSDEFTIEPGCDKLLATCKDKFDILINFGGFPFVPGTDRAVQTPLAK